MKSEETRDWWSGEGGAGDSCDCVQVFRFRRNRRVKKRYNNNLPASNLLAFGGNSSDSLQYSSKPLTTRGENVIKIEGVLRCWCSFV